MNDHTESKRSDRTRRGNTGQEVKRLDVSFEVKSYVSVN